MPSKPVANFYESQCKMSDGGKNRQLMFAGFFKIMFAGPTGSNIISTALATSETERCGSGGDLGVVWTG